MNRLLGALLTALFVLSWAADSILTSGPPPAGPAAPPSADDDGLPGSELLPSNPAGAAAADAMVRGAWRAGFQPGTAAPAQPAVPRRVRTPTEQRASAVIAATFQQYFRDMRIGTERFSFRMPFGLEDERGAGPGFHQAFLLGGKGEPAELWPAIAAALASRDFARYAAAIASPGEKVVILDLVRRAWSVSRDPYLVARMEIGRYPGTPTRVCVLRPGGPITAADAYDYLYAVAAIGVDCTGFTFRVERELARSFGVDIEPSLGRAWHVSAATARQFVGLWFFDPANGMTDAIADRIEDLRPGDMILFRGSDGRLKHSAVIESVDFDLGVIRYVQSTDWAIRDQRGVHRSEIRFDPDRPDVSLRHYTVSWLQQVRPPFEGEVEPRDWRNDGDRFRWYPQAGGSLVVRPRFVAEALLAAEPWYYANLRPSPGAPSGQPARPPRPGAPLVPR
jgi:hypothetical protein